MKVLVINAGSSSLKYQLIEMDTEEVVAKGLCERIGIGGHISHKTAAGWKTEYDVSFPTHKEAFEELVKLLTEGENKVVSDIKEIKAIGHRVLHGSEKYKASTIITDEVIEDIGVKFKDLGPLHNPPQAVAMKACQEVFGKETPMVAVFDTSFHQTMPPKAYMFGIPYEYYEKYSIRRYGFHGTSHRYITKRYFEITGKNPVGTKLIICHLGNGSSLSAVKDGKVVDTSMGLTPLEGLIMGTRSGDIDPAIMEFLAHKENKGIDEIMNILNKKSGVLGLSDNLSSDFRDLEDGYFAGDENAIRTMKTFCYHVAKYIGSYIAAMNGVDVICFTAGVGENGPLVRTMVCDYFGYMGIQLDEEANQKRGEDIVITTPDSRTKVMVIPTNEELAIARETVRLVK